MKQFVCGSVVPGCDDVVTGESEEQVLAAAAEHAHDAHGMTQIPQDLVTRIRAGITEA